MKAPLLCILLAVSCLANAQIVSGLYTGTLVNDSTKKEQRFELALTDYRGKITGYSYTTFVQNDTFFYSIKRVKGTRVNNEIRIEDVKMIVNNFPQGPDKGVRQITHIMATNEDTLRTVRGSWETTRTKVFYSISGGAAMKITSDSSSSSLIRHLKELDLVASPHIAAVEKPKPNNNSSNTEKKSAAVPQQQKAVNTVAYQQRQVRRMKEIEMRADSLYISFYDNGVIDGDSISVYCNGIPVIANAKLLSTATKIAIAFPASGEAEILLVAENLGTLPPNTGLMVIRDGDQSYQLNFTADLQTNASLVLKRKK